MLSCFCLDELARTTYYGEVFNVEHLISSGGLLLIGAIIFAESGLLVGFFLPGDTLLFSAGFFASTGAFPITALLAVVIIAAFLGDNVGFTIGQKAGPKLFTKKDGILFRQEYIQRSETFYEAHGGKTIILARWLPIVRTFAPVVAGAANMPRKKFIIYSAIGSTLWGGTVCLLGYWLGSRIPNIDKYILPIIVLAMSLSFGPAIYHIVGDAETRQKLIARLRPPKK